MGLPMFVTITHIINIGFSYTGLCFCKNIISIRQYNLKNGSPIHNSHSDQRLLGVDWSSVNFSLYRDHLGR
jgi:hypothetical protein